MKDLIKDLHQEIKLLMGILGGMPIALAIALLLWRIGSPLFLAFFLPALVVVSSAILFERQLPLKTSITIGLSGLAITTMSLSGFVVWLFLIT